MQHKESLFALWLEGQLNGQQQTQFDHLVATDNEFAARVETARIASLDSQAFPAYTPAQWHPDEIYQRHNNSRWWQSGGLNIASLCFSVMALVLMAGQWVFDDTSHNNQLMLHEVEQRILAYQQTQQQALDQLVTRVEQQQRLNNAELTNYLLSNNRQERREDFAEFLRFINQQRSDDQVFFARQINEIKQDLYQVERPVNGQYDRVIPQE